jgi:hypothetical protein
MEYWFEKRKFPSPNPDFLPPTGAVVFFGSTPVCGGFLFKSDANAAILGHLVSDPDISGDIRNECLDALIDELSLWAECDGFKMICCSTNIDKLMTRFENHGFTKTDVGVSNFGRIVCH